MKGLRPGSARTVLALPEHRSARRPPAFHCCAVLLRQPPGECLWQRRIHLCKGAVQGSRPTVFLTIGVAPGGVSACTPQACIAPCRSRYTTTARAPVPPGALATAPADGRTCSGTAFLARAGRRTRPSPLPMPQRCPGVDRPDACCPPTVRQRKGSLQKLHIRLKSAAPALPFSRCRSGARATIVKVPAVRKGKRSLQKLHIWSKTGAACCWSSHETTGEPSMCVHVQQAAVLLWNGSLARRSKPRRGCR